MSNAQRGCATGALVVACILMLTSKDAVAAVTERVKEACKADYFAHCNEHAVGSSSLRVCMRRAQNLLSKTCLKALADDGEATKEEVERYKARNRK
jgi:hypothetical protein